MSFDLIRLIAASMVVFSHSFPLAGLPPVRAPGTEDFGALGVSIFFVVSGYLVTGSYLRDPKAYLAKRLLRIEPALIVSLLATVLLGGAVSAAPDYWARPQTYLYVLRNALLYPTTYELPGVFEANPLPHVVNGVLWTLRMEFTCYLFLMLVRGRRSLMLAAMAVAAVAYLAIQAVQPHWAAQAPTRIGFLAARYGFLFCAGSALWGVKLPRPLWLGLGSAALFPVVGALALPTAVIGLARPGKLPADLSYGVYIYAFPLQQLLAAHGRLNFWTAMALTLPLAAASWFLVEKPTLGLKPTPRAVVAPPAQA
ncbi:acyltransferase [Phenylobacterium sp.]|jgi:peptidoglycan/LPS O-acetylase OafA/YrhL|uniref:acyltransferase family protein n=1 Tax=Phenylobacterium sp. TaxID=1871053 RepID=UPI002F3F544B